jgi:hypothetical protein
MLDEVQEQRRRGTSDSGEESHQHYPAAELEVAPVHALNVCHRGGR